MHNPDTPKPEGPNSDWRCDDIADLLPAYVVGALTESECDTVRDHLMAGCVGCEEELVRCTEAAALLAGEAPPVAPRAGLKQEIMDRIDDRQVVPRSAMPLDRPVLHTGAWWIPYVAAALVGIVAGAIPVMIGAPEGEIVAVENAPEALNQRIARTEEALGLNRRRLVGFGPVMRDKTISAHVLLDELSGQAHVLVVFDPQNEPADTLWAGFVGPGGEVLSGQQLQATDDACRFALVDSPSGGQRPAKLLLTRTVPEGERVNEEEVLGLVLFENQP